MQNESKGNDAFISLQAESTVTKNETRRVAKRAAEKEARKVAKRAQKQGAKAVDVQAEAVAEQPSNEDAPTN